MTDHPKLSISEVHLGKFQDSVEFQSLEVNFKNEVCTKSADPHFHLVKARANLFTDHKTNLPICGPNTSILEQFESKLWTILRQISFLLP